MVRRRANERHELCMVELTPRGQGIRREDQLLPFHLLHTVPLLHCVLIFKMFGHVQNCNLSRDGWIHICVSLRNMFLADHIFALQSLRELARSRLPFEGWAAGLVTPPGFSSTMPSQLLSRKFHEELAVSN